MIDPINSPRSMIEGNPALIVIDIQKGSFLSGSKSGIPHMDDNVERLRRAKSVIDAARNTQIPIIFFLKFMQELVELKAKIGLKCLLGCI